MNKIVLASSSPRRRELLAQIGIEFEIYVSRKEEVITKMVPAEIVEELSEQKAIDVWEQIPEEKGLVVIGADTVVAVENEILGKPKDENDAKRMIGLLQDREHQVYTGVTVLWEKNGLRKKKTFSSKTNVWVYPMNQKEIDDYVQTKEPMDKAGAYAIQGNFAAFIKSIAGEYSNVVGLPIGRLFQELKENGLIE